MQKRCKFSTAAGARLEAHFREHAAVIARFRHADRGDVLRMWRDGRNERGEPLTAFEREALVERLCELFGRWPK
jgi:hypothetical protein